MAVHASVNCGACELRGGNRMAHGTAWRSMRWLTIRRVSCLEATWDRGGPLVNHKASAIYEACESATTPTSGAADAELDQQVLPTSSGGGNMGAQNYTAPKRRRFGAVISTATALRDHGSAAPVACSTGPSLDSSCVLDFW
nr:hypothetical protein Iba_chr04aCG14790 [Ipomoea batatas]